MSDKDVTEKEVKIWGLIALVLGAPVYFGVAHFSDPGKGRAAAVCFGVMVIVLRAFWGLRRQLWYWATIAFVVSGHVLLVISIPWNSRSVPAPALAPVGIVDFILVYGLVRLAEKLMTRNAGASTPS